MLGRGQLGQPGGELGGGRVRERPVRVVRELAHLLQRRLAELLAVRVADLHREQPAEHVEVALAVRVEEVRALAALDDRHLLVAVAAHRGEVQPEVLLRLALQFRVHAPCRSPSTALRSTCATLPLATRGYSPLVMRTPRAHGLRAVRRRRPAHGRRFETLDHHAIVETGSAYCWLRLALAVAAQPALAARPRAAAGAPGRRACGVPARRAARGRGRDRLPRAGRAAARVRRAARSRRRPGRDARRRRGRADRRRPPRGDQRGGVCTASATSRAACATPSATRAARCAPSRTCGARSCSWPVTRAFGAQPPTSLRALFSRRQAARAALPDSPLELAAGGALPRHRRPVRPCARRAHLGPRGRRARPSRLLHLYADAAQLRSLFRRGEIDLALGNPSTLGDQRAGVVAVLPSEGTIATERVLGIVSGSPRGGLRAPHRRRAARAACPGGALARSRTCCRCAARPASCSPRRPARASQRALSRTLANSAVAVHPVAAEGVTGWPEWVGEWVLLHS